VKRLASVLVLVLALAALAAGCGGDDSSDGGDEAVEPATWASGFCDALQTFRTGISDAGSEIAGEGIPSGDEIIDVIDNAATAASTFADDLRELGRPDVPSGEEIQNELETAASAAGETFEAVKDEVDDIDNATDVAVAAGAIAEAVQTALTGIQAAANRLQELDVVGTLTSALAGASECTNLGG
jgi:methyl-accepting chemotaxis protein